MPDRTPLIPEMEHLRQQFVDLGKVEPSPSWWERLRGRWLVGGAAVCVGGAAAVAGATQLISTGTPTRPALDAASRYRPGATRPVLVQTAPDPGTKSTWGVQIYDSRGGARCAIVGQVRGRSLGLVANGTFHPYRADQTGPCGRPRRDTLVSDIARFNTTPPRTLYFGRAPTAARRVVLTLRDGKRLAARTGPGGSFLFVLAGRLDGRTITDVEAR